MVPVVDSLRLPIEGALALPGGSGPRRVVILVDASASSNAHAHFYDPNGEREEVPVIEAELRALDHLVDQLDGDWLEFGLIAFGEGTWPVFQFS